jgi:hypothetical protein
MADSPAAQRRGGPERGMLWPWMLLLALFFVFMPMVQATSGLRFGVPRTRGMTSPLAGGPDVAGLAWLAAAIRASSGSSG